MFGLDTGWKPMLHYCVRRYRRSRAFSSLLTSTFLVVYSALWEFPLVFVKVADFDQRRPDLQRGVYLANHIVDYPRYILLLQKCSS